jgi:hypothetical protein
VTCSSTIPAFSLAQTIIFSLLSDLFVDKALNFLKLQISLHFQMSFNFNFDFDCPSSSEIHSDSRFNQDGSDKGRNPKPHQKFTADEDEQLRAAVERYGDLNWKIIARLVVNRSPRQCKERWTNYLQPAISVRVWSQAEDALLVEKYTEVGSKWMRIAKFFDSRTDAQVKNRFLVLKRRGMRAAGIPPPPRHKRHQLISISSRAVEGESEDGGVPELGAGAGAGAGGIEDLWYGVPELDELVSVEDFMWGQ